MFALTELIALKGTFTPEAARRVAALLATLKDQLSPGLQPTGESPSTEELIRLHETVLFVRAYPHSPSVRRLSDQLLARLGVRLASIDPDAFDDPEISGMAGTEVSSNFSFEIAQGLVSRYPGSIDIDWDNYAHPERLGPVLARLAPMACELWTVEPHVDWRAWLDAAFETGESPLAWLMERVDPPTYDLLEIPLRWKLRRSQASRTLARLPQGETYYHRGPLLKRSDVSLEAEFAADVIQAPVVAGSEARAIVEQIADSSAARYRELWGFTHPDAAHLYHAALGRGVDLYFFGVPKQWRLPLRAYHCGMFAKNGVPMGYVETLSMFERAEVGFNLYYTFREGETAWLYARILKVLRDHLGVTCFSIDPYQIGAENEEAVASGAFWFYRKLGFVPSREAVARLMRKEEDKAAAVEGYRTPASVLRRMAVAPLIYCVGGMPPGSAGWDDFSLARLCQRTGRRLLPGFRGADVVRAKAAPEEAGYLRLLQRRPDLRRRILGFGGAR